MGSLGMPEIVMILVIALIIFGPRKLPELGKTLGKSLAQFRRASEDFKRQWEDEVVMERQRIEAPLPEPVERASYSSAAAAGVEETTAAAAEESIPNVSEPPNTTSQPQDTTVAQETKRDWM
ncbi:MAG: twin-arginine translocase TatA/TatE family subunit [Blastocatellia bacterium]